MGISCPGNFGDIWGSPDKYRGNPGILTDTGVFPKNYSEIQIFPLTKSQKFLRFFSETNPRVPDVRRANSPPRKSPGNVRAGDRDGDDSSLVASMQS